MQPSTWKLVRTLANHLPSTPGPFHQAYYSSNLCFYIYLLYGSSYYDYKLFSCCHWLILNTFIHYCINRNLQFQVLITLSVRPVSCLTRSFASVAFTASVSSLKQQFWSIGRSMWSSPCANTSPDFYLIFVALKNPSPSYVCVCMHECVAFVHARQYTHWIIACTVWRMSRPQHQVHRLHGHALDYQAHRWPAY